jgi:hypothetical protein
VENSLVEGPLGAAAARFFRHQRRGLAGYVHLMVERVNKLVDVHIPPVVNGRDWRAQQSCVPRKGQGIALLSRLD